MEFNKDNLKRLIELLEKNRTLKRTKDISDKEYEEVVMEVKKRISLQENLK
jgi:hypothetical protein